MSRFPADGLPFGVSGFRAGEKGARLFARSSEVGTVGRHTTRCEGIRPERGRFLDKAGESKVDVFTRLVLM